MLAYFGSGSLAPTKVTKISLAPVGLPKPPSPNLPAPCAGQLQTVQAPVSHFAGLRRTPNKLAPASYTARRQRPAGGLQGNAVAGHELPNELPGHTQEPGSISLGLHSPSVDQPCQL